MLNLQTNCQFNFLKYLIAHFSITFVAAFYNRNYNYYHLDYLKLLEYLPTHYYLPCLPSPKINFILAIDLLFYLI